MTIPASELVINPSGSIYHLDLHPDQVADTVFLVGDPGRVQKVSRHFDRIDHQVQKREFITHTGWLGKKRLTVLSTGIGTDNIDIVVNELDALVNIDLQTRLPKENLTSLNLIRLGTSGALSGDIPPGSLVTSVFGIGFDNLLSFYSYEKSEREQRLYDSFSAFTETLGLLMQPGISAGNLPLLRHVGKNMQEGITITCPGFYAPQGRVLRLQSMLSKSFFEKVGQFEYEGLHVTNFEMETVAIFGLAKMLGHRAASCNAILANRITGEFFENPKLAEEKLIQQALDNI